MGQEWKLRLLIYRFTDLDYTWGRNTHSFGQSFEPKFQLVRIKKAICRNPKPRPKLKPRPKRPKLAKTIRNPGRNCPKLAETGRKSKIRIIYRSKISAKTEIL